MKKFRKVIVAVLAMAMALGMLTMAAYADEATYNVAGAEGLCGVNWDPSANQMEKDGDVWVKEFKDVKAGTYEFKVATNGAWDNGEYNLEGDASSGGSNASVTVEKDGSTVIVKFNGEKASVEVVSDVTAGVSAPVVAAVIAVVSMVGIVVFTKRRTVAE